MSTIKKYLSLVKFAHTIFAMPFALIGFFLGVLSPFITYRGTGEAYKIIGAIHPNARSILGFRFLLIVLCMIFARSAAMAFNRWLDAEFDKKNPRTAIREIPAGIPSTLCPKMAVMPKVGTTTLSTRWPSA